MRVKILIYLILPLFLSPLFILAFPANASINKWAVIIGTGSIGGQNFSTDSEAREMVNVLKNRYDFPGKNIKLLLNNKATKVAFWNALNWLKTNTDGTSSVIFFFAGHGSWGGDEPPIDEIDQRDENICLSDSSVRDDELREFFLNLRFSQIALIFDSCFSGGMISDLSGNNRIVIASTGEGGYSFDGLIGKYFVHRALNRQYGDLNNDGIVTIEEAFTYAGIGFISDQVDGEMIP